jgi:hypothetical protein
MALNDLNPLLKKEMSRQEFLLTIGLGIASIFGFSHIIHLVTGKSVESRIHSKVTEGYGSTEYGK